MNGRPRTQAERIAVLETQYTTIIDLIGKVSGDVETIKKAHVDLAKIIDHINGKTCETRTMVSEMKPHVDTIANWKVFWQLAGFVGAGLAGVAGAAFAAWSYVKAHIIW